MSKLQINFKMVLVLTLAGLALLFTMQNIGAVNIQFLFWSLRISLALLFFLLLIIGAIIGWLLHSIRHYRKQKGSLKS